MVLSVILALRISSLVLFSRNFPACLSLLQCSNWMWISFYICVMSWLAYLIPVILLPICVNYIFCVRARDLGAKPRILDGQKMWRMSEWRDKFGHGGRSFNSPSIYMSVLVKRVVISGSLCNETNHFRNVSTDFVHMPRLPSWVYWYMYCIVSGTRTQCSEMLVDECPEVSGCMS